LSVIYIFFLISEQGFQIFQLIYPVISYCDPLFTISVSKDYTAFGIADIIAHSLEAYFGGSEAILSDRFVVSIIREMAEAGTSLLKELNNYELRARVLWASTCALNGLTFYGRKSGDWGAHDIGHILSLLYGTPHGESLSIVYPAWMKYNSNKLNDRILWLGKEIFNVKTINKTIRTFENLFEELGCPTKLTQTGINNSKKKEIIDLLIKNNATGMAIKLDSKDLENIMELM